MYYRVIGEELQHKFQEVLDKRIEVNEEISKFLEGLGEQGHDIETQTWAIPSFCIAGICAVIAKIDGKSLEKEAWCKYDKRSACMYRPRNSKKNKELATNFSKLPNIRFSVLSAVVGDKSIWGIGFKRIGDDFFFEVDDSMAGNFRTPEGAIEIVASEYHKKEDTVEK